MSPPKIAALVLAAGRSSRMPQNKLLTPLDDQPVIRKTVETVCTSRADPVIVVTGHEANRVRNALTGLPVKIIENVRYTDGLSTSLICGVKNLPPDCVGFLVVLGDMPLVPAPLIDQMIEAFDPDAGHAIIIPVRGGRRGHPVLWPTAMRDQFLTLAGDKGAKQLMVLYGDLVYELEVETDAIFTDLDTPEDFRRT